MFLVRETHQPYSLVTYNLSPITIVSSPPGIGGGGNDFCVISQAGGQLLNFKSQGGDTFRGDDFRQSRRGELLYHDELLVFPQNASP